jgi:hypothetical protein
MVLVSLMLWCWIYFIRQLTATNDNLLPHAVESLQRSYLRTTVREAAVDPDDLAEDVVVLLTTPDLCRATADVRGNLGPVGVILNNGTDWLKDRWQAASDMGGTAIRGSHWIRLDFIRPVVVRSARLDWETAYSDQYELQALRRDPALEGVGLPDAKPSTNSYHDQGEESSWMTLFSAPSDRIRVTRTGRSPGVTKVPMPLHVIHEFDLPPSVPPTAAVRLLVRGSATGWGVSLWSIGLNGTVPP